MGLAWLPVQVQQYDTTHYNVHWAARRAKYTFITISCIHYRAKPSPYLVYIGILYQGTMGYELRHQQPGYTFGHLQADGGARRGGGDGVL